MNNTKFLIIVAAVTSLVAIICVTILLKGHRNQQWSKDPMNDSVNPQNNELVAKLAEAQGQLDYWAQECNLALNAQALTLAQASQYGGSRDPDSRAKYNQIMNGPEEKALKQRLEEASKKRSYYQGLVRSLRQQMGYTR